MLYTLAPCGRAGAFSIPLRATAYVRLVVYTQLIRQQHLGTRGRRDVFKLSMNGVRFYASEF